MEWFSDKVWFTYKARIQASERLQSNNFHSQLLLVWYVLASTALSIIVIRYPHFLGCNTDIALAILSVALLVITLLVTNCDFRGKSLIMRENYLALQNFHNQLKSQSNIKEPTREMLQEYSELLQQCNNHLPLDDQYWRVVTATKTTREVTKNEKRNVFIYIIKKWSILISLYLIPVIIIFVAQAN